MKRTQTYTRREAGFTMVEMMVTVAVLVILMGVAFVSVLSYQRSMKLKELDETAQAIYVAAQNHLSMAEEMGVLDKRVKAANADPSKSDSIIGIRESQEKKEEGQAAGTGEAVIRHYFYVGFNDSPDAHVDSVLYDMLPRFALDETVRTGGSYAIEYDLESATVTNVFYSDTDARLSHHDFRPDDYAKLFTNGGYIGSDQVQKDKRQSGLDGAIIGWYGGDDARSLARVKLYAPKVELINDECLEVKVSFNSADLRRMTTRMDTDAFVQVQVRGKKSNAEFELTLNDNSLDDKDKGKDKLTNYLTAESETKDAVTYRYKKYILDDISAIKDGSRYRKNHFKEVSEEVLDNNKHFIPGEDIDVTVEVKTEMNAFSNIADSATVTGNSLFEKMDADGTVNISKIRHLENLDSAISGFDRINLGLNGNQKVKQTADLQWAGNGKKGSQAYLDKVYADKEWRQGKESKAGDVQVRTLDGAVVSKEGTFIPVVPQALGSGISTQEKYVLEYDGNNKKISNVKIDVAGTTDRPDAGIFSTLELGQLEEQEDGSKQWPPVKDLELIDCSVKTSNGNAGTLLGSVGSATGGLVIKNVLAHDSGSTVQSKIEGTAAVGGLVGKLTASAGNAVTVDGCGAAVLVSTAGTGSENAAGGLIGLTSGPVAVTNSYAGGHTKTNTGMYDTENYNVVAASGTAGGLIGTAGGSGATIQNCYTTTSVSRGTNSNGNIGGLVGQATGATITNCYVTGLIGAGPAPDATTTPAPDTTRGVFAGNLDSATMNNLSNDRYYEIVNDAEMLNGTLRAVGNVESSIEAAKLSALDADLTTYNRFYKAAARVDSGQPNEVDNAKAYDPELVKRYKRTRSAEQNAEQGAKEKDLAGRYDSTYPLETVYMLNCIVVYDKNDTEDTVTKPEEKWENEHPWAKSHYGDWPSPETLVVNTKQ